MLVGFDLKVGTEMVEGNRLTVVDLIADTADIWSVVLMMESSQKVAGKPMNMVEVETSIEASFDAAAPLENKMGKERYSCTDNLSY